MHSEEKGKEEELEMNIYLDLFLTFAKIGGFTFGGGYAMLPILQREVVEDKGWATEQELLDYYAIGQCTPGIIAVNTATFIGNKKKGLFGGIVATLGVVTPSLVIIILISAFLKNFSHIGWIQHALGGIQICVCVLVFDAAMKLAKKSLVDLPAILLFIAVLICSLFTSIQTFLLVLLSGLLGLVGKTIAEKKAPNKKGGRS